MRCPGCALVGIASMISRIDGDTIERLPEGFKIVKTEKGDMICCGVCNEAADTLPIDP